MGISIKYLFVTLWMLMAATMVAQETSHLKKTTDTITIHPGWPIAREGKNERGGIFCNLDQDVDLEVLYTVGNFVYAFNRNGTEVPGWPVQLNYPTDGVAAFGDIDGDGKGEIVVTTHQPTSYNNGKIYAFETNGTNVFGFPVTTEGGPLRSPVLADIDQDGNLDIVVAIRKWPEGFIHVYNGDGTMLDGWPQRLDYIPASEVAVGDINGDGTPEIIAESYYSLNVLSSLGPMMPGFPFIPGNDRVFSYSAPVLADIDQDGEREIIFGDHSNTPPFDGKLYILKSDGTHFPNWPRSTANGIYAPPAIGDIDGDGTLDVSVGEYGAGSGIYKLYAWNGLTGENLPGFPVLGLNNINSQVILADLDGDGEIELMFDDNTDAGIYLGYNHDGTPLDGWPLEVDGSTFYINPFVADLNGDGIMEISGGGYVPEEDVTYLYLWDTEVEMNNELALLPIFQYNTRHSGIAGDYLMVDILSNHPFTNNSTSSIHLFPNPTSDHLSIDATLPRTGLARLEIADLSGKIIETTYFMALAGDVSPLAINLEGYQSGMYLAIITLGRQSYSAKFQVSK